VHEHVAATCIRLNKAIALGCVEPLNNSGRHRGTLSHSLAASHAYSHSNRAISGTAFGVLEEWKLAGSILQKRAKKTMRRQYQFRRSGE
jgi:hypothetical protein